MKIKYSIFVILFLLVGCHAIDNARVTEDFNRNYPNSKIKSIQLIEGDSDSIYYRIYYYQHDVDKPESVTFLYQRDPSGKSWLLMKKLKTYKTISKYRYDEYSSFI